MRPSLHAQTDAGSRFRFEDYRRSCDRVGEEPARRHHPDPVLPVRVRADRLANLHGSADAEVHPQLRRAEQRHRRFASLPHELLYANFMPFICIFLKQTNKKIPFIFVSLIYIQPIGTDSKMASTPCAATLPVLGKNKNIQNYAFNLLP